MLSSTSNSNERLPEGPWGRTHLLALALVVVSLGGLELFWRARGHVPSVVEDKDLWCLQRERAAGGGAETLAVLGASRMQCNFVPSAFLERCPGYRIANLSVAGAAPMAALADLAADPSFRGTVLCGVTVPGLMPDVAEAQQEYVDYYHSEWGWNKRLGRLMRTAIQENLTFVQPYLSLHRVARGLLQRGALPPPYFVLTRRDRYRAVDFAKRAPWAGTREEAPDGPAASTSRGPTYDTMRISGQEWQARLREIEAQVRRIQGRGGRVIFFHPMSGGARRLRESSLFPRRDYWDTFAKSTSAFTLHWEDVPAFADFALPDEVHLDYRDAPRFTRLLADELCARGALRPRP